MSFNYPGPFNLTGVPGQVYSLVADDGGRITIEEGVGPGTVDLTTDVTGILPTANGGTGAANLNGLAKSGSNSDITHLTGLTTPLSAPQGGTGSALFSSGTATFVSADSVDVVDATITSSSIIVVTEASATPTDTYSVVLDAGVKFTIHSSNATSTATVNYIRVK
jgi:hypothetical protein